MRAENEKLRVSSTWNPEERTMVVRAIQKDLEKLRRKDVDLREHVLGVATCLAVNQQEMSHLDLMQSVISSCSAAFLEANRQNFAEYIVV